MVSNTIDIAIAKLGRPSSEAAVQRLIRDISDDSVKSLSLSRLKAGFKAFGDHEQYGTVFRGVYDRVNSKVEGIITEPITKKEGQILIAMAENKHDSALGLLARIPQNVQKEIGVYKYLNPTQPGVKKLQKAVALTGVGIVAVGGTGGAIALGANANGNSEAVGAESASANGDGMVSAAV